MTPATELHAQLRTKFVRMLVEQQLAHVEIRETVVKMKKQEHIVIQPQAHVSVLKAYLLAVENQIHATQVLDALAEVTSHVVEVKHARMELANVVTPTKVVRARKLEVIVMQKIVFANVLPR